MSEVIGNFHQASCDWKEGPYTLKYLRFLSALPTLIALLKYTRDLFMQWQFIYHLASLLFYHYFIK